MQRTIALCLLLTSAAARAQDAPAMSPTPVFAATGAFYALTVKDLDASTRWYEEKLGLKVVVRVPHGGKFTINVLQAGSVIVELIQNDEAVPLREAAPGIAGNDQVHGIFKVGFLVADFDRTVAMLRERHVEIVGGPWPPRRDQQAQVQIRDNAGNLIQIFGEYAKPGAGGGDAGAPARRPPAR